METSNKPTAPSDLECIALLESVWGERQIRLSDADRVRIPSDAPFDYLCNRVGLDPQSIYALEWKDRGPAIMTFIREWERRFQEKNWQNGNIPPRD